MGSNGAAAGGPRTVAVTGAGGYVGSQLVRLLLEQGHRVRGVVRDPDDGAKTDHLRALPGAEQRLELHGADLMQPGAHDAALAGCDWLCHLASPVRLAARDPQRDIVEPAVAGTRNVLESARRAGVARVALTSSIAAVAADEKPASYRFSERDWNETATVAASPYQASKLQAERAAWDFHAALDEAERFGLVALCPTLVLGPLQARVHARSSPANLRDLVRRKLPGCPRFAFGLVDVRDVAAAHLRALADPRAEGRYILSAGVLDMRQIARLLAPRFAELPIPTWPLPDPLLYAAALFDKRLSWRSLWHNLGKRRRYDATRSTAELGLQYRPLEQTLIDTVQSFVDLGLVQPRRE